jgi:hypothetical protein
MAGGTTGDALWEGAATELVGVLRVEGMRLGLMGHLYLWLVSMRCEAPKGRRSLRGGKARPWPPGAPPGIRLPS